MREFLSLLILAVLIGAVLFALAPEGRQTLDRVRINAMRAEHQARYHAGEPLAGTPDLARLDERLSAQGVKLGDPVMLRLFKLESQLELWVEKDGRFVRFATYPICLWSGRLGPKLKEGDRQAPEGFYTIAQEQLNPNSRWHRAFNLGFPNLFDKTQGARRLLRHGAWRMLVGRLLRHDRSGGRRALAFRHGGARRGRGEGAGARLPVPHDRRQSESAPVRSMGWLLDRSEEGPRPVRADANAAGRQRMQRALRVFAWKFHDRRQRHRGTSAAPEGCRQTD